MLGRGPAQTPNLTPYELLEPQGVPEDVDGADRSKVEASFAFGKARKRERKLTEGDRGKTTSHQRHSHQRLAITQRSLPHIPQATKTEQHEIGESLKTIFRR